MSVLKYKNFQGSASFEDGVIVITILHIDDFITGECDKASDVEKCFQSLVEEYLETCTAIGKTPCRPYKGSFNVRMAPDLHKAIAYAAAEAEVSLNAWVEKVLADKVDGQTKVADSLQAVVERLHGQITSSTDQFQQFVWVAQNTIPESYRADIMREAAVNYTTVAH